MATGARVRNAYGTYPPQGDNPPKGGLIPHGSPTLPGVGGKAYGRRWMALRAISWLVG